ncbi:septum site-determining protein MinC [uncultured Clostridium sp.]|uniref:septum site-determining protein MinC n=1 Tax=uncultured Clostridium sp. TaxID=59620 RepID=UPI002615E381|nr:septum site-determining protein MinC [uncultured Clostridium sp.]
MNKYPDYSEMFKELIEKLEKGKQFYKGISLAITIDLNMITEKDLIHLQEGLKDKIGINEIVLNSNAEEKKVVENSKVFAGIYEGKTKFLRKTIRGGQCVSYNGNMVIIGDINSGAEVIATGNVIVLGSINGTVFAGSNGNDKAVIAAFSLYPEILKIADRIAMSPDSEKPTYPEIAKIKDGMITVEPYLVNKYIY